MQVDRLLTHNDAVFIHGSHKRQSFLFSANECRVC